MGNVSTNIKIDEHLKKDAQELFAAMGLNLSIAVNMFLSQAVREQGMPFISSLNVDNPRLNRETLKAIKEFHEGKNVSKSFTSIDELMEDLDA